MYEWGPHWKYKYKSVCSKCGAICDYINPKPNERAVRPYMPIHLWDGHYRVVRTNYAEKDTFNCEETLADSVLRA